MNSAAETEIQPPCAIPNKTRKTASPAVLVAPIMPYERTATAPASGIAVLKTPRRSATMPLPIREKKASALMIEREYVASAAFEEYCLAYDTT